MRSIGFWFRLSRYDDDGRISKRMFQTMLSLEQTNHFCHPWILNVKRILNNAGYSHIYNDDLGRYKWVFIREMLKSRLRDIFVQDWRSNVYEHERCINYRIFKDSFEMEHYLMCGNNMNVKRILKFRTRNSNIPVAKFGDIDRTCTLCNAHLADEFHYVLLCPIFQQDRRNIVPRYVQNINVNVFKDIMISSDINALSTFIGIIFNRLKSV